MGRLCTVRSGIFWTVCFVLLSHDSAMFEGNRCAICCC
jgi:hypothetical protein